MDREWEKEMRNAFCAFGPNGLIAKARELREENERLRGCMRTVAENLLYAADIGPEELCRMQEDSGVTLEELLKEE